MRGRRSWKKTLWPWLVVAAMFTQKYWFPSVYRAFPAGLWMVLVVVLAVFGVWRWVAYFAVKRS